MEKNDAFKRARGGEKRGKRFPFRLVRSLLIDETSQLKGGNRKSVLFG